jgi:hypothetical protein
VAVRSRAAAADELGFAAAGVAHVFPLFGTARRERWISESPRICIYMRINNELKVSYP